MRGRLAIIIVGAALAFIPGQARTLELGLTPGQVFSLWTNINDCLVASASAVSDDGNWRRRLAAMKPRAFAGKVPADVLERLGAFRAKLDRMRRTAGLAPTARLGAADGAITPSVVFLNSGQVLNGLVEWLIGQTGPEQLVSRFYTRHGFKGKTPSDVFGQVDLADRRLGAILARLGR